MNPIAWAAFYAEAFIVICVVVAALAAIVEAFREWPLVTSLFLGAVIMALGAYLVGHME